MFAVPSTPDSRRGEDIEHPSTTPAGPPPTGFTNQSFTPAGRPPPSSVFGATFGNGNSLGTKSPFSFSAFIQSPEPAVSGRVPSRGFTVPSSSPAQREEQQESRQPPIPENEEITQSDAFRFSNFPGPENELEEDMLDFAEVSRGSKRSRNGNVMAPTLLATRVLERDVDRPPRMPSLVDTLIAGLAVSSISDTDDAILNTETILEEIEDALRTGPEEVIDQSVQQAVRRLLLEWSKHTSSESIAAAIGPVEKTGFARASYIASLLLQLHHPSEISGAPRTGLTNALITPSSFEAPTPKALLDWLNKNHNPFPEDLPEVQNFKPSATSHDRFWDTVFQTLLRGRFSTAINLLGTADWAQAYCAIEDGYQTPGYKGAQLSAVQNAVGKCVELLRTCPALNDDDWVVTGADWSLFRSRTSRALDDLEKYAESDSADKEYGDVNVFAASGKSFAAGSRRAESKVPWTVYEQLKAIYGQILGLKDEILLSAQDWLEATVYLTVWWNGEEEIPMGASRRGLPARQRNRPVDLDPIARYQRKLLTSFASVTDDPEDSVLGVNATDPVQVALGAVFEGEVESVLKLLLKWSPLVTTAVVDVASAAGWMPSGRPRTADVMDGFDQEDLMVLSHGQVNQRAGLDRDTVLVDLAEILAKEDQLSTSDGKHVEQGWKIAVRILSRLDSASVASTKIAQIFNRMQLKTSKQVDDALAVCNELGLSDQVREISERYAESLASSSQNYGQALLYYARAHSEAQLQSTLDLLLSTSLVRSAAYPPPSDLDPQLRDLLSNQTGVLTQLARVDNEAARLLADKSSGYATLRRFYELRDETDDGEDGENAFKSGLRPAARKKEMVKGLVALAESAGESIRGGLFDANSSGVVQVETLLSLLGEALPLLHGE